MFTGKGNTAVTEREILEKATNKDCHFPLESKERLTQNISSMVLTKVFQSNIIAMKSAI